MFDDGIRVLGNWPFNAIILWIGSIILFYDGFSLRILLGFIGGESSHQRYCINSSISNFSVLKKDCVLLFRQIDPFFFSVIIFDEIVFLFIHTFLGNDASIVGFIIFPVDRNTRPHSDDVCIIPPCFIMFGLYDAKFFLREIDPFRVAIIVPNKISLFSDPLSCYDPFEGFALFIPKDRNSGTNSNFVILVVICIMSRTNGTIVVFVPVLIIF
mmetsp:Transcript_35474/g.50293  ORF Transcript_35474/g.50293 Transcript_35474/m.50293 type:complete len:213 (-) Transcript_35474:1425-2063(-)